MDTSKVRFAVTVMTLAFWLVLYLHLTKPTSPSIPPVGADPPVSR